MILLKTFNILCLLIYTAEMSYALFRYIIGVGFLSSKLKIYKSIKIMIIEH